MLVNQAIIIHSIVTKYIFSANHTIIMYEMSPGEVLNCTMF